MVRGQPDYGQYAAKDTTASVSDMGEVATRLGSVVTFDKRGAVIDLDDFENPILKWDVGGTAGFYNIYLDSASTKSGGQACKLECGNLADSFAVIDRWIGAQGSEKLGAEFSFSDLSDGCYFQVEIEYCDGGTVHYAQVRIDPVGKKLYIRNSAYVWEEIATFKEMQMYPFSFYTVKLVADFTGDTYMRVVFGNTEYDLSAHSVRTQVYNYFPFISAKARIVQRAAPGGGVWVDNYILTQSEP